jgi:hypothetical protein
VAHQSKFVGKKYGYLTILSIAKYRSTILHVLTKCDCGNEGIYVLENMERGKVHSCGCLKNKYSLTSNKKLKERILSLIDIQGECWIWKGMYRYINKRFYPFVNAYGSQFNPTRWFAREEGEDINVNWCYVTQCGTEKCVNPYHHAKVSRSNIKKAIKKEIKSEYLKRRESGNIQDVPREQTCGKNKCGEA